jgi:hypothetical protein
VSPVRQRCVNASKPWESQLKNCGRHEKAALPIEEPVDGKSTSSTTEKVQFLIAHPLYLKRTALMRLRCRHLEQYCRIQCVT